MLQCMEPIGLELSAWLGIGSIEGLRVHCQAARWVGKSPTCFSWSCAMDDLAPGNCQKCRTVGLSTLRRPHGYPLAWLHPPRHLPTITIVMDFTPISGRSYEGNSSQKMPEELRLKISDVFCMGNLHASSMFFSASEGGTYQHEYLLVSIPQIKMSISNF